MPPHAPTAPQRALHFILPVLFISMSAVFLAVPYGLGQPPGSASDKAPGLAAAPLLLACSKAQPGTFRGTLSGTVSDT